MNSNLIFAQEIIQRTIGIQAPETVQVIHRFYRQVPGLQLVAFLVHRLKAMRIVLTTQPPRSE